MKIYDPLKILYPCFIQAKLNGVYAELDTDGIFTSRTGKYFPAIQKIWGSPPHKPHVTLCGEFYVHGWPLQKIISGVMPDDPNDLTHQIYFHVYDYRPEFSDPPQYKRFETLKTLPSFVTTTLIRSSKEGDKIHEFNLKFGYEGSVYRPYSYGDLLKRKPFKDAEYECIAVHEGVGKRKGHVGKFVLRGPGKISFGCGGGKVSYNELRVLFQNPPIGKMITVRYQHTSTDGIPLCAQFIAVRSDYE